MNSKAKDRATMSQYADFSKEMELPQQMERVYGDGLKGVDKDGKLKTIPKNSIIKVKSSNIIGIPNSITQVETKRGGISRNYYDEKGFWAKQITNNNHGNKKKHPYGKKGEHAHDIIWEDGKIASRNPRELTDEERKENEDILWGLIN